MRNLSRLNNYAQKLQARADHAEIVGLARRLNVDASAHAIDGSMSARQIDKRIAAIRAAIRAAMRAAQVSGVGECEGNTY